MKIYVVIEKFMENDNFDSNEKQKIIALVKTENIGNEIIERRYNELAEIFCTFNHCPKFWVDEYDENNQELELSWKESVVLPFGYYRYQRFKWIIEEHELTE